MKLNMKQTVLVLAVWCLTGVFAAEKTITVEEGATIGLTAALTAAGFTLEEGDTLVKMGGGRLTGSADYKDQKVHLRIVEGVFEGNRKEDFFKEGDIAVRAGATLDVNSTNGGNILSGRRIYLRGTGSPSAAVTVNGRSVNGALLIRGSTYHEIMLDCRFYLDGEDVTIGSICSGNNGYLSRGWFDSKNGDHTLTLMGPGHTLNADGSVPDLYQHRFRYGHGFTNMTERIVVDGAALTAHNVGYRAHVRPLPLTVKNRGSFGPDGAAFGACFSLVTFEWGSIVAGDSVVSVTLPPIAGFPQISARTTATIDNSWTIPCAELVEGHRLVAHKALTFGGGAKVVLADVEKLDSGTVYTLATSTVSVTGCPKLSLQANQSANWQVTAGADGKSIQLAYVAPEISGLVNVRDWGVRPGVEHAEANVAAFNQGLAALDTATHTIFFPPGNYSFASPIVIGNRSNLTLLGEGEGSQITVTDEAATQVLSVSGGSNIMVTSLKLSGGAGVAVDATGTPNLAVTNNVFAGIAGTIADVEGTYPVRATDCTDVVVRENVVTGDTTYTGHLLAAGTTTVADLEPSANEVVLFAHIDPDPAKLYDSRPFAEALAERGLAEYPQGAKLVKKGLGKLAGPPNLDPLGLRLGQIEVREGTIVSLQQGALGPNGNTVTTGDEATVLLENTGDGCLAEGTTFVLKGDGAKKTAAGAPLCVRSESWRAAQNATFKLESDATIRHVNSGQCGLFSECTIDQQGHTLTLLGTEGRGRSHFRFRLYTLFRNSAPIIARNLTLSGSYKGGSGFRGENGVRPPLLKIEDDAQLLVNNQDFADVFEVYEFEPGAQYNAENAKDITTANVKGPPELLDKITLNITNSYTAVAAELLAGKKMTAVKTLKFGAACVVDVVDAADLPIRNAGYVLATSQAAISGRPKATWALTEAGWTTALSSDGKSLLLKPVGGTMILIR